MNDWLLTEFQRIDKIWFETNHLILVKNECSLLKYTVSKINGCFKL